MNENSICWVVLPSLFCITLLTLLHCKPKSELLNTMDERSIKDILYSYYPKNLEYGMDSYFESNEQKRLMALCKADINMHITDTLLNIFSDKFGSENVKDYSLLHDGNPSSNLRIKVERDDFVVVVIVLNISHVVPLYCAYKSTYDVVRKTTRIDFISIKNSPDLKTDFIAETIDQVLPFYMELPPDMVAKVVPDISTAKKGIGEATFFDCLFTDHLW